MGYQIDIPNSVKRQIEALPGHIRQRVKRAIAELAYTPYPQHAEELRGVLQGRYKIKLDLYRIVYRVEDEVAVVMVLKVGKKQPGFYDGLDG
jgi:mRNA interferase RelE/StbE